jgi:hypothetical protein
VSARTLELPLETSARIQALQELSKEAEGGDKKARRKLRRALRESSPVVVARCSDSARTCRSMIARTAGGGDPLIEDALMTRAEMMRLEIAGENPTPLELLLAEKIVTLYLLSELHESLNTAQLYRETPKHARVPITYTLQMVKWQESVSRRYLAAIRELARVRKLQAGTAVLRVDRRGSVLAGASAGLDAE